MNIVFCLVLFGNSPLVVHEYFVVSLCSLAILHCMKQLGMETAISLRFS